MIKDEANRQLAQAESLRQEREVLRRRIETLQQQARERTESWETERKTLLGKVEQGSQQFVELDKRFRAEQAALADLRRQLSEAPQTAPRDVNQLRQDVDVLRRQLDEANAELTQARQQNETRGQSWTVEKRSLLSHHQEECRRLTDEFEQRLKAELTRCRESYEDQLQALQRERDSARAHFDALKQAVYHPEQSAEEDDIPRLPEPPEESADEDRSALEQRLMAEQSQLQAALRKSRQLLDDQRQQFEEDRKALVAEVNRMRQRLGGGRPPEQAIGVPPPRGTTGKEARRRSWLFKGFLYLLLFLLAVGTVVVVQMAIVWANKR
jgi:hypothetical protein